MGKSPQTAPCNRRGIRRLIQTIIPKITPQPYPSLTKLISQPSLVFQHDCHKCYRENHAKLSQTLNAFLKFISSSLKTWHQCITSVFVVRSSWEGRGRAVLLHVIYPKHGSLLTQYVAELFRNKLRKLFVRVVVLKNPSRGFRALILNTHK